MNEEMSNVDQRSPDRRRIGVIGIGIFVTFFATHNGLGKVPLQAILKDQMQLPPHAMADFFAIAAWPLYLKPLAGVISDRLPLLGARRRPYLLLSGLVGAALWTSLSFASRSYVALLITAVGICAMATLGNVVIGGILGEMGRERDIVGRLSAVRTAAMNTAALVAAPLGGRLAERAFGLTCATGAALMLGMTLCALVWTDERAAMSDMQVVHPQRAARERLGARMLWACVIASLVHIAPGINTIVRYYQRDVLELSYSQIGWLGAVSAACGILGAVFYAKYCRRLRFTALLYLGIGAYSCSALPYLWYRSLTSAYFVEAAAGFLSAVGLLPVYELAARATTPGNEALGYALVTGVSGVAFSLSDPIGTRMTESWALSLSGLVWINVASTAVALFIVPLLSLDPPPAPRRR